jgi:two-component system CheB/CheR fusion protein
MSKTKMPAKVRKARRTLNATNQPRQGRSKSNPPVSSETIPVAKETASEHRPEPDAPATPFPIVGVGASAGGLEAFTALLTGLRADTGMAFVLIQHMDPKHGSVLVSLLRKATAMPVREVADGMAVEPNHVYVIPPNTLMTISKGVLKLEPRLPGALRNLPIDRFFQALADDLGSGAIGVILSGTASDGTGGLRCIKAQGGITFAQDRESARYAGMPLNAVAAGCVDLVLPPEGIAAELSRINGHPYLRGVHAIEESDTAEDGVRKICTLLRGATGVEFRLYKPATIARRIARRMALRKLDTSEQYTQLLIRDRDELHALYEDIFIHVTGFFRDPESVQALQQMVFAGILSGKEPGRIRIWVPGCSSGEEVYTIAMLLFEQAGEWRNQAVVQIFGTDISDRAIEQARSGIYPESSLSAVSRERQKRFFTSVEGGFQIAKSLRDVCVFARHDLAKDPPFSRLDLISCRNVLIYMGPVLQKRVIETFHYALKPGGHLLLGRSESLSAYSNLFSLEDSKHKVFARRPFSSPLHLNAGPIVRAGAARTPGADIPATPVFDSRREAERVLLDQYAPAALVVDSRLQIIHFQGKTSPFLAPAAGEPSFHLLKMARPELVVDLRTAIHQARKEGADVRKSGIPLQQDGSPVLVDIQVWPLKGRSARECDFLVVLQQTARQAPAQGKKPPVSRGEGKRRTQAEMMRRDRELASAHEQLRAMIQDNEAASEEMRAMNEEVLSSNEELQSTNEELETAKEELESSNEELTTLNDELHKRNAELSQLTDDLSNLLTGVDIPILFLDTDLRIRRFTPLAGSVLHLMAADVGRPITEMAYTLEVADWRELASQTIRESRVIEREVRDGEGHWYTLRMRPYKTGEKKIEGVLVALLDIDAVKRSLEEASEARDFAEAIVETVRGPLLVLDAKLRVERATGSFYETFGGSPLDTEGRPFFELGGGQWDIPRLRTRLEEHLPADLRFEDFEVEHDFPSIGYRCLAFNARQIRRPSGGAPMILLAIEDVTQRRRSDLARLATVQEEERRRVARELHDDLIQRLAGLGMDLGAYAANTPASSPRLKKGLRQFQSRVVEAAEVGRRVAYELHPFQLEDLGLAAALRAHCESLGTSQGLAVDFTSRSLPDGLRPEVAACLYRVAQESLRNIAKHAQVKRATVTLQGTADSVRLSVEDRGIGFTVRATNAGPGLGLVGMKDRVQLVNGKMSIESDPGKGTRLSVEIPL